VSITTVMQYYDSHPNLDALELHLLGRLSADENSKVDNHLLGCYPCQQMAADLNRQIEFIRDVLSGEGAKPAVRQP
jgi:anti-sigma factor RsiW